MNTHRDQEMNSQELNLPGDTQARVTDAYAHLPRSEPSAALDARILAAARASLAPEHARTQAHAHTIARTRAHLSVRRIGWIASAAVVVLAFGIGWPLRHQMMKSETSIPVNANLPSDMSADQASSVQALPMEADAAGKVMADAALSSGAGAAAGDASMVGQDRVFTESEVLSDRSAAVLGKISESAEAEIASDAAASVADLPLKQAFPAEVRQSESVAKEKLREELPRFNRADTPRAEPAKAVEALASPPPPPPAPASPAAAAPTPPHMQTFRAPKTVDADPASEKILGSSVNEAKRQVEAARTASPMTATGQSANAAPIILTEPLSHAETAGTELEALDELTVTGSRLKKETEAAPKRDQRERQASEPVFAAPAAQDAPQAFPADTTAQALPHAKELKEIRAWLKQGRITKARDALRKLLREDQKFVVPDDLKHLLKHE